MEMNRFPRHNSLCEGLKRYGFSDPSTDLTPVLVEATLAAEVLTGVHIFRRDVVEVAVLEFNHIFLRGYNPVNFEILSPKEFEVEEVNFELAVVRVKNVYETLFSKLLNPAAKRHVKVRYNTGFVDGELPSVYQLLIFNVALLLSLPPHLLPEELENDISRLLEVERVCRLRCDEKRLDLLAEIGIL